MEVIYPQEAFLLKPPVESINSIDAGNCCRDVLALRPLRDPNAGLGVRECQKPRCDD